MSDNEHNSDNQLEKAGPKRRNYVMTPGRQAALEKMRAARERKLKEKADQAASQQRESLIEDPTPVILPKAQRLPEPEPEEEEEAAIIIKKKKKQPKQKIIYLESDSEEEEAAPIIIKKSKSKKKPVIQKEEEEEEEEPQLEPQPQPKPQPQPVYSYGLRRMINFV